MGEGKVFCALHSLTNPSVWGFSLLEGPGYGYYLDPFRTVRCALFDRKVHLRMPFECYAFAPLEALICV
jgi:hypothetical protein